MKTENQSEQNLLWDLEAVSATARYCKLDITRFNKVGDSMARITGFFGITSSQAVLFATFAELGFHSSVSLESMARHFRCSNLKLLTYKGDIDALEKKGYIRKAARKKLRLTMSDEAGYKVPLNIIDALSAGDITLLDSKTKFDLPGFLKQVSDVVEERSQGSISTKDVLREIDFLVSANSEMPFVKLIDGSLKSTVSKCTALIMGFSRLNGQHSISVHGFADTLFDDLGQQLRFEQELSGGRNELISQKILKLTDAEFEGEKVLSLTEKAAKILYSEYPALLVSDHGNPGIIKSGSIKGKKLFFNDKVRDQLKELESILNRSRFKHYCRALKRNNLTSGITAVFYGISGTGKTEAVYQVARRTRRNIMMVDLSQTRSKWFGESEKQVRQIFDDYASLLRNSDIEPILFINEADGLFTKRLEINDRTTSSDQTMNIMQNILLQSLERFEGILIVTTNLNTNLDKAFERRFSFRIEFSKPDQKTRQKIWLDKLPELTRQESALLSEQFEITGGDIDVHVRKILLKRMTNRNFKLKEMLFESCSRDEGFTAKRKIGFKK
ncbi:MAG: AAA family ATPase [Bacteroidales bacterium]|nr:AAA family ATPase [Bacteroidales bacterium]MBN2862173.1 AAA family ATPase [Bacteroidales bacterium]